VGTDREA